MTWLRRSPDLRKGLAGPLPCRRDVAAWLRIGQLLLAFCAKLHQELWVMRHSLEKEAKIRCSLFAWDERLGL